MQRRTNLRFWRIKNGLKQVDIYRKLKISSGYYSNLEKGKANPSFSLLVKFKDIFDVDDVIELFRLSEGVDSCGNKDTSRDISKEQVLD